MTVPEHDLLLRHLRSQYQGVFTDEAIERHVRDYLELEPATALAAAVLARAGKARDLLDIGCGFGAFVLGARELGADAVGIELAPFEVAYARRRLAAVRPGDDAASVYVEDDAQALPFPEQSFDVVTLWNVLEHVPDAGATLREAARVLRNGGWLFAVAPNYAAVRREAHYHVPWLPLLPRRLAAAYLRGLGRDPEFFLRDVHYVTNRGVRRAVRDLGLQLQDPQRDKLAAGHTINRPAVRRAVALIQRLHMGGLVGSAVGAAAANPLKAVITIEARKP